MRPHSLSAALAPAAMLAFAQGASAEVVPDWVATYEDGALFTPYAMATSPAGESFVVATINQNGEDDVAVVKFDALGQFVWQQTFDGASDQDIAADIALSADGTAVYALGRSRTLLFGDADFVILKYDASTGENLWIRYWDAGEAKIESPQAIAALPDGGIVATGGAGTTDFKLDYGTVCFDADGAERWQATFRGSGRFLFDNDVAYDVVVTPGGDVVISGLASLSSGNEFRTIKYDGTTGEAVWFATHASAFSPTDLVLAPNGDVVLFGEEAAGIDRQWVAIRYAGDSGATSWTRTIDPGFDESTRAVTVDASGDVYATGATDPDGDDGNNNENMITVALDGETGAVRWLDEWGEAGTGDDDYGNDLWTDGLGNLFVVGLTGSEIYTGSPFVRDALIRKLDASTGTELDMGLVSLSGAVSRSDAYNEAAFDAQGNVYLRGISSGDVGVVTKLVVARYDGEAQTGVAGLTPSGTLPGAVAPSARPSVFRDRTVVSYALPRTGAVRVAVYDAGGRLVRTLSSGTQAAGAHEVSWMGRDEQGRSVPSGMYFARLEAGSGAASLKLILAR